MTPAATPGDTRAEAGDVRRGFAWLRRDEGWPRGEGAARLGGAVLIALAAVALKLLIVRGLGGELGYLSYLGAVVVGAWVAGLRGGLLTTAICAIAEVVLFAELFPPAEVMSTSELYLVALFLFDGVLVSAITSGLRRATHRERLARDEAEANLAEGQAAQRTADADRLALQRLQAVTASLASAATPGEVADAILDRGLAALDADAGGVSRVDADGRALTLIAARGYPADETRPGRAYPIDPASHLEEAVRTARPVFVGDPVDWASRYPSTPPHALPGSPTGGAIAVLPMVVAGAVVGVIVFRFAEARDFGDGTGDLAARLADQGAQALDRAVVYEQERATREALERGQKRLRFLSKASDRLALRLEIASGLDEVTRLAVPDLADWAVIELLDLDRPIVAVAADGGGRVGAVEHLVQVAPRGLGLWLAPETVDQGATLVSIDSSWFERLTDPLGVDALADLGTRTLLVSQILGDAGDPVGSIVLGAEQRDRFEDDDVAMCRDLASRIGVAAGQARLFGAVDRFKATVDASGDAVYMFDPSTLRVVYVNRGGADLVGLDAGAVLGSSVLQLQPAHEADGFRARLTTLRTGPTASTVFTGVLIRSDGHEIPVEAFLQEVVLPDARRTAILTARDVSDRIDVQARLTRIAGDERRQAAELRAVIQAMGEGILVADHAGRISLANDAVAEILGEVPERLADLDAILGMDLAPVSRDGLDEPEPGQPHISALADGRWVEIATYPADLGSGLLEAGNPSTIVVVRDVTQAREAEAAREAFLGVLSHELRTPVTTIFGYAKVLRKSGRRPDREAMLADIEVEADRLYRIVEDLLALSRVEGGITIEGEPLLIQHIVRSVVASEAQRWDQLRFETDLPSGLPAVFGEQTYVEQVLRNMVANAGKYSPAGTVVTVVGSSTPTEVLIKVLDRGPGIKPDEADRLFDLYYRSPGTARSAAGAGIGLYVGRGLVTAMGGRIWARRRSGGGSEFGFSLPRCDEDPIAAVSGSDA